MQGSPARAGRSRRGAGAATRSSPGPTDVERRAERLAGGLRRRAEGSTRRRRPGRSSTGAGRACSPHGVQGRPGVGQHQPRQVRTAAATLTRKTIPTTARQRARDLDQRGASAATRSRLSSRKTGLCGATTVVQATGRSMMLSTRRFPLAVGAALGRRARLPPLAGPGLPLRGGRHAALRGAGEEPRRARGVRARDRRAGSCP